MKECTYCGHKFTSKHTLNTHQKTAKYCLKLQGNMLSENFTCEYCNKTYTQHSNLNRHKGVCIARKIIEKDVIIKELKERNVGLEKQVDELQKKLDKRAERLEDKLENIAIRGVEKSTTTNTRNVV